MATPAAANDSLTFTPEQATEISGLAWILKVCSGLLIVLGGLHIVYAVLQIVAGSWGSAFLEVVQGALFLFSGLVMVAATADAGYLHSTKGAEQTHLANLVTSWQVYCKVLLGLGTLCLLVLCFKILL